MMRPFTPNPRLLLWRLENRVGVIVLNRRDRKNPLTFDSYQELIELFRAIASPPASAAARASC